MKHLKVKFFDTLNHRLMPRCYREKQPIFRKLTKNENRKKLFLFFIYKEENVFYK